MKLKEQPSQRFIIFFLNSVCDCGGLYEIDLDVPLDKYHENYFFAKGSSLNSVIGT